MSIICPENGLLACSHGPLELAQSVDVIAAHENILDLGNQDALTALEKLTHTTQSNPNPVMSLSEIAEGIPAMFRRAA